MNFLKLVIFLSIIIFNFDLSAQTVTDEKLMFDFKILASKFESLHLESLPLKDRGRLKPLDTLSRENNLYLTGKSSLFGTSPSSFFLALNIFKDSSVLKIINIRSTDLRSQLNLDKKRTLFSLDELERTEIMTSANLAMEVEKKNKNLLTPIQAAQIEAANQIWLLKSIQSGDILFTGLIYLDGDNKNGNQIAMQNLLSSLSSVQDEGFAINWAKELMAASKTVSIDKQFLNQRSRMDLEVLYTKLKLFFWAGIIYFVISFLCFLPFTQYVIPDKYLSYVLSIPLVMLFAGFSIRVYITEFPPVTNMYGTMIWVAFGISTFSFILNFIYKDRLILGIMSLGAALLLLLTENIPLIISPNMDPIVAVLRSSYWLTIHVLTVTISYAAFSMAMILGNIVIISEIYKKLSSETLKRFSHYAYRSIQLGILLLTAGIILGGVWADYSWGRFWGWDPKETWALIADLGFLAILHGRIAGWISPKNMLILSPATYILVIMAWFGVNFILATGLHSYGFSTGGTFMVVTAVIIQIAVYVAYFVSQRLIPKSKATTM